MSSNLRVDRILPSTGTEVGVGTATGSVALYGDVNIAGTLTYEDVTNIDSVGVVTARSDIYLGNDIYLTDGASGYEKVEVDSNDIRVEQKHIHSEFGVWTRSASVNDRRLGIEGSGNNLLLYANSAEKVRITDSGNVGIGTDNPTKDLTITGNNPGILLKEDSANSELLLTVNDSDGTGVIAATRPSNYTYEQLAIRGQDLIFETTSTQSRVERLRITSDGKVAIGFNAPAVAGLSISNSSTNRGFEFDTGSGFDSTSCIRAYDRPTTAYKSLGLTGSDIKFGINDVEKVRISSGGLAVNKNAAADTDIEIVQSADPTLRLYDTRNVAYKADFMMAGSAPLIRNNNTTASNRTLTVQKGTTDHLVIEGGGQVATPLQPRFLARLSANVSYNPSGFGDHLHFNTEDYDIGGNFTTSGADIGLFTAPISGNYAFSAASYASGILQTQSWFTVNGSRKAASDWVPNQSGNFVQNFQIIYLSTGDKVGFHPHRGGTSSFTVNANTHHTYFKGCLLG